MFLQPQSFIVETISGDKKVGRVRNYSLKEPVLLVWLVLLSEYFSTDYFCQNDIAFLSFLAAKESFTIRDSHKLFSSRGMNTASTQQNKAKKTHLIKQNTNTSKHAVVQEHAQLAPWAMMQVPLSLVTSEILIPAADQVSASRAASLACSLVPYLACSPLLLPYSNKTLKSVQKSRFLDCESQITPFGRKIHRHHRP